MRIFASKCYRLTRRLLTTCSGVCEARRDNRRFRAGTYYLARAKESTVRVSLILLLATIGLSELGHAGSPEHSSLIVEDIRCKGNALTRCAFIRGFLYLSPGDALSEDEIQNARLRLSSLPNFASVQIYLNKGSAKGRAVVIIEVVEADRIENQVSAGTSSRLSSLYQTVEGRVAERDVFGTQGTVNLDVEGSIPIDGPTHRGIYTRLQFASRPSSIRIATF